jgi:hypothetical protein
MDTLTTETVLDFFHMRKLAKISPCRLSQKPPELLIGISKFLVFTPKSRASGSVVLRRSHLGNHHLEKQEKENVHSVTFDSHAKHMTIKHASNIYKRFVGISSTRNYAGLSFFVSPFALRLRSYLLHFSGTRWIFFDQQSQYICLLVLCSNWLLGFWLLGVGCC